MKSVLSVIIARYNEDLSWLVHFRDLSVDYDIRFYVYDKSGVDATTTLLPNLDFADHIECHPLPNIGRESHTYLHHILERYDDLQQISDNYMIFLQGNISDHMHGLDHAQFLRRLVDEAAQNGASTTGCVVECDLQDFRPGHPTNNPDDQRSDKLRHVMENASPRPLGPWYQMVMDAPLPNSVPWWHAALFCIRSDRIALRTKATYELIFSHLQTRNPEVTHYLERMWLLIFS